MGTFIKMKTFALYFFLLAGGLWQWLGVLQDVMRITAGPVVMLLAIWVLIEYLRLHHADSPDNWKQRVYIWSAVVVVSTFLIEYAGVVTGKVFGAYEYGPTLQPQLLAVPISIGFAWLGMLLSSAAIMQKLLGDRQISDILFAAGIALFMVLFDLVMEPAAVALNYWNWFGETIPIQNYAAWFAIGFLLALLGLKNGALRKEQPTLAIHAYMAQLLYFAIVLLR